MSTFRRVLHFIIAQDDDPSKRPYLSEKELELAAHLIDIGESIDKGDYEISSAEHLSHFEDDLQDLTWTPEDEAYHTMKVYPDVVQLPGKPNMIQFSKDEFVELSKVEEAVQYYGSKEGYHNNGTRIRPSLSTMKHKFRFIVDENHLKKLREYEIQKTIKANRKNNLEFLSNELEKEVRKQIEDGQILHDSILRFLIVDIIKKQNINIDDFIGSNNWLAGWKRRYGISSRKITKFVSRIRHKTRDQIEKDSQEFVKSVNHALSRYPLSNVFNADQSGFQLEMNTARTLAYTGSKDVHCVVKNVSSTTHSYTVMPLISASGKLHPKLFVTLKEKNGEFPKKGHYHADNLVVTCHSSHIMTKELMKTFFKEMVFDPTMPKDALLLVDSWSSWKDQGAIDSVTPASNKLMILMIPPGCTGRVQPCDVGIFGGFKKVIKILTNYAQLTHPDYKMHTRDETLKVLSLVWRQFCAPELEPWVQYAWHAAGYDVPRPPTFKTPAEEMFPRDVAGDCAHTGCPQTSNCRCLYCKNKYCFEHFVICDHDCKKKKKK